MNKDANGKTVNVSNITELPSSNKKEEEGGDIPLEAVPLRELTPGEAPPLEEPISSAMEEELLNSPCDMSSEGEPQGSSTDAAARGVDRRAKRTEKKRRQRHRKREQARQAMAEGRVEQEDPSRKTLGPQATSSSSAVAGTSASAGQPDAGSGALDKGDRGHQRAGRLSAPTRGPRARDARREAKRRPIVLPSAPAAKRDGGLREGPKGPSSVSRPAPQAKRPRTDQTTPPERRNKIARGHDCRPTAGRGAHVSPMLRGTGAPPSRPSGTGPQMATYSSAARRELQVVIRSNRPSGEVTAEEGDRIRAHVVGEMLRAMAGPEGGPRGPELRFRKSGLVEPGWFLITAHDETSRDWLLEGLSSLVEESVTFSPIRAVDAPWPVRIGFWLRTQTVDVERVTRTLDLQNRSLNVSDWRHLETTGGPGGWYVSFLVGCDIAKRLEEAGWELFYELFTLTVRKLAWGGAPNRGNPEAGGATSAEEEK